VREVARDLGAEVVALGEQRLGSAVTLVPVGEQGGRIVDVLVAEGQDLETRHAGRDDSVAADVTEGRHRGGARPRRRPGA
jgi:hypothetical protein